MLSSRYIGRILNYIAARGKSVFDLPSIFLPNEYYNIIYRKRFGKFLYTFFLYLKDEED